MIKENYINLNITPSLKKQEIIPTFFLIDCTGLTLGKIASKISSLLRGKNSPKYTPNMNMQIKVIVINSEKFILTGNKWTDKKYYKHSGYLGGLKVLTAEQLRDKRGTEELVRRAVLRMMKSNILRKYLLRNLFIFKDENHSFTNQKLQKVSIPLYYQ